MSTLPAAATTVPPMTSTLLCVSRLCALATASLRYLSARNIPYLNFMSLDNINCRDILRAKKVVASESAMATLKERYGAE